MGPRELIGGLELIRLGYPEVVQSVTVRPADATILLALNTLPRRPYFRARKILERMVSLDDSPDSVNAPQILVSFDSGFHAVFTATWPRFDTQPAWEELRRRLENPYGDEETLLESLLAELTHQLERGQFDGSSVSDP